MRKFLSFAIGALMLASCSTPSYIQIVDVKSDVPTRNKNYVYNDGQVEITYNFWGNGGDAGFFVQNLTDQVVYVDLANSFHIKNGAANDYFRNRTFGKGSSATISNAVSATAASYGVWTLSKLAGSKSVSASATAASGSSSSVTVTEKDVIAIPPHAYKCISEYNIASDVLQDCSVKLFPKKKSPETMVYSIEESPLKFTNYITYKVGENGAYKAVTQDFYIAGYTNYNSSDVEKKEKAGCKDQLTVSYNKHAAPSRYYVTYGNTHSNNYSADAKEAYGITTVKN